MWLILVIALLACAVVAIGAALNSGPKHPRHAAPRHLEAVPDPPPDYGSMILDAERTVTWDPPAYLLAAPVDPEPWAWREQMTAELAPEALDPLPAPTDDPGAGDVDMVSSVPAPDPDWLEAQLAILFDWVRSVHATEVPA